MAPADAAGTEDRREALLVWDVEAPPPEGPWTTVLWSAFETPADAASISLPKLVEEHADELRARYLAFVHDLGAARIGDRRLMDHLELRPGFSYWWMTLLAHKPNYYESPQITDVVKCLAFEWLCLPSFPRSRIRVGTRNTQLRRVFAEFCRVKGLPFQHQRLPPITSARAPWWNRLSTAVHDLRWIVSLAARQLSNVTARGRGWEHIAPSKLCVFDLLVHLNPKSYRGCGFASNYWGNLPSLLDRRKIPTTWIHGFFRHPEIPSVTRARSLLRSFNASTTNGTHVLLDSRLGFRALLSAVCLYVRIASRALTVRGSESIFRPTDSHFDFWPFFKRDWYRSLLGAAALRNCMRLALYERVLSELPYQSMGIYILENQAWEMALLYAWRAAGHGRIIGVPHTTVRFWDLRYFYDRRTYVSTGTNDLPMPDIVAVNGPVARKVYQEGGYPESRLFDVEALRFLHVADRNASVRPVAVSGSRCVLVCGDNLPGSNDRLMQIVQGADRELPAGTRYIFKPHKAGVFDPSKYQSLDLEVRDGNLAKMLDECDAVLTGGVSSAAVDAYCRGKPVASLLNGDCLNGDPLRGIAGPRRFTSVRELVDILAGSDLSDRGAPQSQPVSEPYFWLGQDLRRWRELLGLD